MPLMLLARRQNGRSLHFWDFQKRKHVQEIDLGPDHQLAFERGAYDPTKAYGFELRGQPEGPLVVIWTWYRDGDNGRRRKSSDPGRARRPRSLAPVLRGFKAVPPLVTDIDPSMNDRFLYVACWGTGDLHQYDLSDLFDLKLTGKVTIGGIVSRASPLCQLQRQRQAGRADSYGRDQPATASALHLHHLGSTA